MREPAPLDLARLFPALDAKLIELLRSLRADEWTLPTACRLWTVKDIAAHLLDGNLRRLSFQRDDHPPPRPKEEIEGYREMVEFLNQLNADWVRATDRLSPRVLIDLLEQTGAELARFFASLDPRQPALFAVTWAGEETSCNGFDIAREYTEKWHHQQQIRDAAGRPGITSREFLHPVLNTFLRALPHHYRKVQCCAGTLLKVQVTGEAGGDWFLLKRDDTWSLLLEVPDPPHATAILPQDVAWKLFTKGLSRDQAEEEIILLGDRELASVLLDLVAVMA